MYNTILLHMYTYTIPFVKFHSFEVAVNLQAEENKKEADVQLFQSEYVIYMYTYNNHMYM